MDQTLVVALIAVAAIALLSLPVSIWLLVRMHEATSKALLSHLESTQVLGGTPASIVRQQNAAQLEMGREAQAIERKKVDAMADLVREGVDPERVYGN